MPRASPVDSARIMLRRAIAMRVPPLPLFAFVVFSLAGCGAGAGDFGGNGGGGGSGGSGGGISTSTSEGGGGGSAGGGSGGIGGQGGSTGTGGAGTCDDAGFCGNTGNDGCVACAVNGPCAEAFDACFSSDDCSTYESCVAPCAQDPGCLAACDQAMPAGKELYGAYFQCVLCEQCPVSCTSSEACAVP